LRIKGVSAAQSQNLSVLADIFANLDVGDTVRAQVLDIFTNEVLLKLLDGTTQKAALMSKLDAKRGDTLEFKVTNKNEGQLFLETVKSAIKNDNGTKTVQDKLLSINIKPTAKNMEIALEIVSAGLELDSETFGEITDALDTYRTLKPKEAVFLKANNIEINTENINILRQIADGDFKIGSELRKLLVLLETDENRNIDKPENIIPVSRNEINEIPENKETKSIIEPLGSQSAQITSIKSVLENISDSDLKILFKDMGLPPKLAAFLNKEGSDVPLLNLPEKLQTPEGMENQQKLPQRLQEKIIELRKYEPDAFDEIPPAAREKLEIFLSKISTGQKIAHQEHSNVKVISATNVEKPAEQPNASDSSESEIFGKPFANVKDELYVRATVHDMETAQAIRDNIRNLKDVLDAIKNYAVQSGINNSSEIPFTVEGIQSRISFMNSINNQFLYYQIPLNMKEYDTTGELYIMKRRGDGRKKSADNLTFFISLDTMNMGYVGSLIEVNRKNISINLKLENNEVIEYFKDNRKILYKSLLEKGYRLVDIKYRLPEEKVNILNIAELQSKETSRKTASFDLRV
jgi:hypothetical protein